MATKQSVMTAVLALCLAACTMPSTKEMPASLAVAVTGDALRNPMLTTPRADAGTIVLTRDTGILSHQCPLTVLVDKVPAADLMPGERVTLYVRPGVRIVSAEFGGGRCGRLQDAIETTAVVGEVRNLRAGINGETFLLALNVATQ